MKDQTKTLLSLLEEGKTCNEICEILHISNKQLYNNLTNIKNKGFLFSRSYSSKGDITYKTTNFVPQDDITNSISLKEPYFKVLVISDLHFGNSKERLDRVNRAFNYCIKNNIHIIFCCGDFIDGTFSRSIQTIPEFYEQVDYFLKNYPFDKSILTFGVGGDHDLSGITNCGQDFLEAIYNYRHDCIVPSYGNAIVKINNTEVLLHHYTTMDNVPGNIIVNFFGHSHKYTINYEKNGQLLVKVPSISDINVQAFDLLPSALEVEFIYEKNELKLLRFGQIYFGDKDYLLNQVSYEMTSNKKKNFNEIDACSQSIGESQTDKFIKRLKKSQQ